MVRAEERAVGVFRWVTCRSSKVRMSQPVSSNRSREIVFLGLHEEVVGKAAELGF